MMIEDRGDHGLSDVSKEIGQVWAGLIHWTVTWIRIHLTCMRVKSLSPEPFPIGALHKTGKIRSKWVGSCRIVTGRR